jgi:formylmethanofuran dehydrogenase subunit E-like metal-binding protein
MLDETSDIQVVSQLAMVLWYIHDGNIQKDSLVSLVFVLT